MGTLLSKRTFKTLTLFLCFFTILSLLSSCNINKEKELKSKNGKISAKSGKTVCVFDGKTGLLNKIEANNTSLDLEGIIVDVAIDDVPILQQTTLKNIGELETWTLPQVTSRRNEVPENYTLDKIVQKENQVISTTKIDDFVLKMTYILDDNSVSVSTEIMTLSEKNQVVSGVTYIAKGLNLGKNAEFEFPGSFPEGQFVLGNQAAWDTKVTEYSSPVTRFIRDEGDINVVFVNQIEKWRTGVLRNNDYNANIYHVSATEGYLNSNQSMVVGDLTIQLCGNDDSFETLTTFYTSKGWVAPSDGYSDGPLYSGHPYGTMDSGFSKRRTLQEYSEYLDEIFKMGFKNIWLLPIFFHPSDNVYSSIDQTIIDPRYGGTEGAKVFTSKAHELGLRVLFDYVPHGPDPNMKLPRENPDWCSKKPDGTNQIEWDCVSFDYNNISYQKYTLDMVKKHATEIGIDGARIDCAMGGLSNWRPTEGNRPSASGLKAGVEVSRVIRQGVLNAGKTPLNMPENFHPVPFYAPYTDLFYDMPLYRVIYELNHSNIDSDEYVSRLSRWLSSEEKSSPKNQVKLRYLGNHDTVTWVWDSKRPVKLYGTEKAKAMWALISFIDGVPMIYEGDEDPSIYGENIQPKLVSFFTELFKARKDNFGDANDYDIEYIFTNSPVMAFKRVKGDDCKTVLINLSDKNQTFELTDNVSQLTYSNGVNLSSKTATLEPYGFAIIK